MIFIKVLQKKYLFDKQNKKKVTITGSECLVVILKLNWVVKLKLNKVVKLKLNIHSPIVYKNSKGDILRLLLIMFIKAFNYLQHLQLLKYNLNMCPSITFVLQIKLQSELK